MLKASVCASRCLFMTWHQEVADCQAASEQPQGHQLRSCLPSPGSQPLHPHPLTWQPCSLQPWSLERCHLPGASCSASSPLPPSAEHRAGTSSMLSKHERVRERMVSGIRG